MSVTISSENINQYRTGSYPSVSHITWIGFPLDPNVLSRFPNLQVLHCPNSRLNSLAGIEVCSLLQELNCQSNKLDSLAGIEACSQLQRLYCSFNSLTTLAGIEACSQLQKLYCSFNHLTTLAGIEHCPNLTVINCGGNELRGITEITSLSLLQKLHCSNSLLTSLEQIVENQGLQVLFCHRSQLTTLAGIERFPQLIELSCNDNALTSLAGIENCLLLQKLDCSNNSITTLNGLDQCTQLRELSCYTNQLKTLDCLVYLRHLVYLTHGRNPLDIQTPQVQRFLTRFNGSRNSSSIYSDGQNVHDTHIQKSVCDSVRCLMTDSKPTFTIQDIIDSGLDEHVVRLLIEYCGDETVHSVHLLTYIELLAYVWARVMISAHKHELLKILAEQICDSECMCFTGRFNRTLSVLVGFCDDIVIEISDSSRIGAIILAVKDRVIPYDPSEHRSQASKLLLEAGYDADTIEPWLGAISEP